MVQDQRWEEIMPSYNSLISQTVMAVLDQLCESELTTSTEVSITLANDAIIQDLNHRYRDKNKPTNVLSFPANDDALSLINNPIHPGPLVQLGDIVLAFETLQREAKEQHKPFENHFMHLLVHGMLHLLGFDHQTDNEAEDMEKQEKTILEKFNIPDPYRNGQINN